MLISVFFLHSKRCLVAFSYFRLIYSLVAYYRQKIFESFNFYTFHTTFLLKSRPFSPQPIKLIMRYSKYYSEDFFLNVSMYESMYESDCWPSSDSSFLLKTDQHRSRDTERSLLPLWSKAICVTVSVWEESEHSCLQVAVSHNINAACSGFEAYREKKKVFDSSCCWIRTDCKIIPGDRSLV